MAKKDLVDEIYKNNHHCQNQNLDHHTKVALRELALEEIRQKYYLNYLSILSSLYVSKNLEDASKWAQDFININRNILQIVKLRVTGNLFTGDAHNCFDGTTNKEENLILAKNIEKTKLIPKTNHLYMKQLSLVK